MSSVKRSFDCLSIIGISAGAVLFSWSVFFFKYIFFLGDFSGSVCESLRKKSPYNMLNYSKNKKMYLRITTYFFMPTCKMLKLSSIKTEFLRIWQPCTIENRIRFCAKLRAYPTKSDLDFWMIEPFWYNKGFIALKFKTFLKTEFCLGFNRMVPPKENAASKK